MINVKRAVCLAAILALATGPASAVSLREAVRNAVHTHPSISAARANRDATVYELRQAQGRFLPQVDLSADIGAQYIDRPLGLAPERNKRTRLARQATLTVSQVIFDGWDRSNDLYKRAARIDAASLRVLQRSEVLALEAVEAYIDVYRHAHLLHIARRNIRRHQAILRQVYQLVDGGKAPRSDIGQTVERVAAAKAVAARIEQALLEAHAKFRQVTGLEPKGIRRAKLPRGLPRSRTRAVKVAIANNPAIKAAGADVDAARFTRDQSQSSYFPTVTLQGTATTGEDVGGTPGRNHDLQGRVVVTWNLFNGNIKANRERELTARLSQTRFQHAAIARRIGEAVERAFAAYRVGSKRVAIARQQVEANQRVVVAYGEEYHLSKRSLLDLLDAENALFNSRFQLASNNAIYTFAGYQLQGAMGILLTSLRINAPAEAATGYRNRVKSGVFDVVIEPLRK